jgi:enterochelin esterase-like enzyme
VYVNTDFILLWKNQIIKTNIFYFLAVIVVLVTVVCVYLLTAYKNKKNQPKEESDPFAAPSGFDKKKGKLGNLTEKSYSSKTTGTTQKCYVYTPPGYKANKVYPVMYLLHGINGTHTEWKDNGNPDRILSNLINACDAKRMIVVMPNVRFMNPNIVPSDVYGTANVNAFNNFFNELKNDLMPFIEKEYKVSKERTGRAIAGLSMGGMESLNIGISMPETFGFIGAFSAAPSLPFSAEQMKLPDEYKNNTFIMICCGLEDGLLSFSQDYNKSLTDNGVQTTYYTIRGGHDFGVWKNGLYNFAKRIF